MRFLDRHGLELIAVERVPIQHGSIVGTVQVKGGKRPVEGSVRQLLKLEEERRLDKLETLAAVCGAGETTERENSRACRQMEERGSEGRGIRRGAEWSYAYCSAWPRRFDRIHCR